jgi:hypothetical protein
VVSQRPLTCQPANFARRGINLSPVDKLKADLLQVLGEGQQIEWSDRWAGEAAGG